MRAGLRWALLATLALSVAAWWWPPGAVPLVAAVDRAAAGRAAVGVEFQGPGPVPLAAGWAAWPQALSPWAIEPAERDPFVPLVPLVPAPPTLRAVPPPAPAAAAPPLPPPAPAPVAPALNLRFLGRMTTPEGAQVFLLARGDTPVPIALGTTLDEGYVVKSISSSEVSLVYPALGTVVVVPIPAPPPLR
jgi:hypothetical protein